jgi:hypothetical protein
MVIENDSDAQRNILYELPSKEGYPCHQKCVMWRVAEPAWKLKFGSKQSFSFNHRHFGMRRLLFNDSGKAGVLFYHMQ